MKKLLLAVVALMLGTGLTYAGDPVCIVEGKWENPPKEVKLFAVHDGALTTLSSYTVSTDGKFYFAFAPGREGFYTIGLSPVSPLFGFTFYFKPGDRLTVDISGNTYKLVGNNTPENTEMEKWHDTMVPLEQMSYYFSQGIYTYVDFFPLLVSDLAEIDNSPVTATGNDAFDYAFTDYRRNDYLNIALNFLVTPRQTQPKGDDFTEFYTGLDPAMFTDKSLLEYPYGMNLLRSYSMIARSFSPGKFTDQQKAAPLSPTTMLDLMLPVIADDKVKAAYVAQAVPAIRHHAEALDFGEHYGKYLITAAQKKKLTDLTAELMRSEPAAAAMDFTFPDAEGNSVSLSDFKGKVVYIDVWATWCGPCKQEMPYLKELEAEYHDKDVVFMSVATDREKDKGKWLQMVKDEELKGIQLFGGDRSREGVMEPYGIAAIPRFIMVGKDGRLVSGDAPRPSSGRTVRGMLDTALAK